MATIPITSLIFRFVFKTFDQDNDDSIGFCEFLRAVSIISHGTMDDKLDWAFRLYDIDNNGQISKSEMFQIMDAISSMLPQQYNDIPIDKVVDDIFNKMDTGKGHLINYDSYYDS